MSVSQNEYRGVDRIFDSAGNQLAPLGYGFGNDWELIEHRALSAATNGDFFWAADTYDEIEVVIKGLQPNTDDRNVLMRISDDGSTFESGAIYDYFFDIVNHAYGRAFRGARVSLSSAPGPGDLDGNLDWSSEIFDTDGFWASSPNPERLTIPNPTDITKVRLTANLWFNSVTGNTTVFSRIFENNSISHAICNASAANADPARTMETGDIAVSPGDFFTVGLSLSDTSYGVNTPSNFSLEVTETIDDQEGHGAGQTEVLLARALGTGTNERVDVTLRFHNVQSGDFKRFSANWEGTIADGNARTAQGGGNIQNTGQLRGVRLFGESSATLDADEVIVRGRQVTKAPIKSQDDWVVLSQKEASASASIDFVSPDDFDVSLYDEFELVGHGITPATDGANLNLRVSDDNGATWEAGTQYDYANDRWGPSLTRALARQTSQAQIEIARSLGNASDEDSHVELKCYNLDVDGKQKEIEGYAKTRGSTDGALIRWEVVGRFTGNTSPINGLRLLMSTGNIATGKFTLRGRRKTPTGASVNQDWELIEHQILTGNQSTITFTDIPSLEFDEFELTIKNLNSDTSAQQVALQFSNDNGSTWDTGANYQYASLRHSAEAAFVEDRNNGATSILLCQDFASTSVRLGHGRIWFGPLTGGSRKHVISRISTLNDAGNQRLLNGGGLWFGTGSDDTVTAFRLILLAGGNFTAGSEFTLRGRRKIN